MPDREPLSLLALRQAGGGDSAPPPPSKPRLPSFVRRLWLPGAAVGGLTLLVGAVLVLAPSGRATGGGPRPAVENHLDASLVNCAYIQASRRFSTRQTKSPRYVF